MQQIASDMFYADDLRLARLLAASSLIASAIAAFGIYVLAAGAVIGLPLAWLAIQHYMSGFATRAPVGGWTLALGLLLACVVALAATVRHALAAMRLRPAQALRE